MNERQEPAKDDNEIISVPGGAVEAADLPEDVRETLRQHDPESRYRTNLGLWHWVVAPLAIALTLFQLYTAVVGTYPTLVQGAIHVAGAMGLIFLLYPARRKGSDAPGIAWYDVILAAAALFTNFYIVAEFDRLGSQAVTVLGFTPMDQVVALLGIALVLEGTRRCVGLPIVVIASCALLYGILPHYLTFLQSWPFGHPGFDVERYATQTYFTTSSIFGTPIRISSTFIFLFLFFGVLLVRTNIGAFFNDLAFGATGRFTGGTAKAAVVASALQGTVSGSSVANTVASGSFTIPMMKRAGFRPPFAAATEASASTGGQLVPPVMGAAAFIMAEYTGVPYNEIIVLAIFPALLYFTGVFLSIHFEARRSGIVGLPKDRLPQLRGLVKRLDLLLPLVVIVYMLLSGRSPISAALWGIVTAFLLSLLRKDTRLTPRGVLNLLEAGARAALPVIAACATAGIVAGTVTKTGLGGKLARGILDLAFGNFFLILLFTMIACLILGMGLPTTANYVVTATVAAPILVQFDVPLIAAHLFVFYFGILADITPPVCLAAYAASGLARTNPMTAGVTALRVAIAGFIIPFVFVLEPSVLLVDATPLHLIQVLATAILGMLAIAAGLIGHLMRDTTIVDRVLLIAAGIALVYPSIFVSLAGLAVLIGVGAVQRLRPVVPTNDPLPPTPPTTRN